MSNKSDRRVESTVLKENAGREALEYLLSRFTYWNEEEWTEALEKGHCRLNGEIIEPTYLLQTDDLISLDVSHIKEPEVHRNYEILHEEETFMVINKPGDLPVHPGGPFYKNTLWYMLLDKMEKPHLINRLDRETSGIILIAKNPNTARHLARQFERRKVTKKYKVLVEGSFPEAITAKGYLAKDEESPVLKKQIYRHDENYSDHGKNGVYTEFRCLEQRNGLSLVICHIHTGKMHQIRVSLHSLGFPVVGDKIYGPDPEIFLRFIDKSWTDEDKEKLRLPRQALHSYQLEFLRPVTQDETLKFEIPLAEDMAELFYR